MCSALTTELTVGADSGQTPGIHPMPEGKEAMAQPQDPTCVVVRAGESYAGKQQLAYFPGVSAKSAGARGLCMHLLTIPPGGRAKAHRHRGHETAIYVLSGHARMWFGDGLRETLEVGPGDFLYIPAGTPHLPANLSQTEPCTAVIARTDPNEQESIELLPELDAVVEGS